MSDKISKNALDRAGNVIREQQDNKEYHDAIEILNRWREYHVPSMDFYFDKCNDIANKPEYKGTIIAERLKRLPTIINKLHRLPGMRLSSMQDIGGVRVILDDIPHLENFYKEISKVPELKSSKDYLTEPKSSGYRGYHLIFEHDSLLTEVQLRTKLEHLWATSVETVDVICGTSMKTEQSDNYWQKFFELTSSAFAYIENLPMLPQHHGWDVIELRNKIKDMMNKYPIEDKLKVYAATQGAVNSFKRKKDSYFAVVTFNSCRNKTTIAYYPESKYQEAVHKYEKMEDSPCNNSVLVSVSNLKKMQDAYPNYFMDISRFKQVIKFMLDYREKMS